MTNSTTQGHKYDGVHYQVTLMNMRDGSVQGHKAGCADLTRKTAKYAEPIQAADVWDVETKADAHISYNCDFLAEGGPDNAYDIEWLPCTKHIPAGDVDAAVAAFLSDDDEAPVLTPVATSKVGRKWTYIYAADGSLIAEVRNDQADVVRAMLLALNS